ncbi:FAD-binding oxidoreductase [Salinisphaera sp. LB1]|uniref:NAD(P)/FAD-dependent oxidoreductase n=1 Tax=Salinisphaera sp. LB1 TaxID=2183911 RepID=UPI000D707B65|nr:FAD-dependent oxidoreductase [Salinisphaera sp. LB1]AWN16192.1 D-amino acid dehydrogenase family protein in hydroxy-L-proline catabolic cluster [Salinisphaera sp. LB1]
MASTNQSARDANKPAPAFDLTVVGAGIIGVTCALDLQRAGYRVLVLDSQAPGHGASYGNAGHMATEQVFPVADASILVQLPKLLMDATGPLRVDWRYLPKAMPWFLKALLNLRAAPFENSVNGLRALNQNSLPAWHRLLASTGDSALLRDNGSVLVFEKEHSRAAIQALQARMQANDVPVDFWEPDTLARQAPALSDQLRGALFFPATGHCVNPMQLVDALVTAARREGVEFVRENVRSGHVTASGVALHTDQRTLTARKALVACGAHSAPLVKALTGVRVPLDTERGYHLMLPHETGRLPFSVTSFERRFIMTPMNEGLRLAGTVEFAGLTRPPNMARAWQLETLSHRLFRQPLDATDATPWMGFRPSLPDSLPIIDHAMDGRVLLAFGHHHLGLTQAALTAEMITSLAASNRSSTPGAGGGALPDFAPYRLARFA